MKKYFTKGLKILLWILLLLCAVVIIFIIALQIPAVQRFSKNQVVSYLESKFKTKVQIDNVQIGFPKDVVLEGIYLEDQKKDTLLYGKKIAANINLFQIFNHKIEINAVDLEGIVANINVNSKAEFNFDYIIKSFESNNKPDNTSPPMEFVMDKIAMNTIKIYYKDANSKSDLKLKLQHLDTKIKTFDLNQMNFEVPKIKLSGLQLSYKQGIAVNPEISTPVKSKTPYLKLKFGTIDLSQIKTTYQDETSKLITSVSLEKLLVKETIFDLKNYLIELDKIELSNAIGNLNYKKLTALKTELATTARSKSNNWNIKLNNVNFKKVAFTYNDDNEVYLKKGIDYNHLQLQNLSFDATKFKYTSNNTSGKINSLLVSEKSGLKIDALKTTFYYGQNTAYLKNLYLKTPQTILKNQITIRYPSPEIVSKNPTSIVVAANLKQCQIGFKDILLFAPQLTAYRIFKNNPTAILSLNSTLSGKLNNLFISNLQVSGIGITKIDASGRITGLPNVDKTFFDLKVKNSQTSAKDVYSFMPQNTIPNTIQLPAKFSAAGTFKGTIDNFITDVNFISSSGNAKIAGNLDRRIKDKEKYKFEALVDNFNLGSFLKNDSIGKITLKMNVDGKGFNPKSANATVSTTVIKANFNHYNYQNLVLNGTINKGLFKANALLNDPNLKFDLISNGSFKDKYPAGKINLNVDIADLKKLNLHAGALKLRGNIDADIQSADLDYLNGKASIHNLIIANDKDQFATDSITVLAVSTSEKNTIKLNSQFMDAEFIGKYKLSSIATSLKNSISNYYNLKLSSKNVPRDKQQVAFKVNIKSTPILLKILPDLKSLEPITFSGRYNTVNDSIVLNGSIPKLVYGSNSITNGSIKIDKKDKILLYNLSVDQVKNAQFEIPKTSISGQVANNVLDYSLLVKDFKNKDRYQINGKLQDKNGGDEISFDPKKLLLNYESWAVADDNRILFANKGIYVTDLNLSKEGKGIKLQSKSMETNAPLAVDFKNFEIKTISNIVKMKNLEMDGTVNGTALLKNLTSKVLFTADLKIDNFTFRKDTLGTVNVKVNNEIANIYDANVAITGQENQVNLDGTYRATDDNLNMNLNIQKLNIKSIQGFSMDYITDGAGFLTGNFKITGKTSNPKLIGALKFNDVGFKATKLNSKFKSINDSLIFVENAILLDNFTIKDEKDNDLTINGKINNQDYSNLGFDLTVDADNFKAINSKAKDNDTFYGELFLDNHLFVTGTMDSPKIDGTIKINKDTKFTIVLPQDDPSIADREGIVEFIDQDQPKLITLTADKKISETEIKGIDASVTIEVDKEAELSLIIDKSNGDFLKLKGEAQLTGGIDPSGKTTLVGRYELEEGSYEMSFNLIKRKFNIKKGSYLLWTGEPTSADIVITAVYKTESAPIDLLNNQLGLLTPEERNTYKQKIPFETELKMNGELLKPNISFDIILPKGNNSVSSEIISKTEAKLARLRQEPDELNKQVFALLLLNRFIGENPFSSESGGTTSSLVRESASKILSQQLNNLASDFIKGFELNFDIDSSQDFTTGKKENKTDLNVGLSKKLLNDRLKVTVGSSFGIEGPEQKNKDTNTIAGDISGEYLVSKDGRYKVRAYRKNLYQVALQGQVIETGVGFIITLDYNKFQELFHLKKETSKPKAKKKSNE